MKTHGSLLEQLSNAPQNMFCRMFSHVMPFRPKINALKELAETMRDRDENSNSSIAAGYTYLGQFIDHDITRDAKGVLSQQELEQHPNMLTRSLEQLRTPSLDLDSLYGAGPKSPLSMKLYDLMGDPIKFKIGSTTKLMRQDVDISFKNDLPREVEFMMNSQTGATAIIGDDRNDENLAVAQTHLAFLKFHNNVVDKLRQEHLLKGDDEIFALAKETVVKHYQSIVLHDFLPKIVDSQIYEQIIVNGHVRFFDVITGENPCMPIEFSGAAFRLHSLIRDNYQWNRFFSEDSGISGSLRLLFTFTGRSNFDRATGLNNIMVGNKPTLPTDWIIDWRRFFDFEGQIEQPDGFNRTKPMDTKIAESLFRLPGSEGNLAAKNLIRGAKIGLPTAQTLLKRTGIEPVNIKEDVAIKHGFNKKTPLWYYLMVEAEIKGEDSAKLGPLGSTILCEAFQGLVKGSTISIFGEKNWKPSLPSKDPNKFTMTDLLMFNNDIFPIDNN